MVCALLWSSSVAGHGGSLGHVADRSLGYFMSLAWAILLLLAGLA